MPWRPPLLFMRLEYEAPLDSHRDSILTRATPAMRNPKHAPCRWISVAAPAVAAACTLAAWIYWRHPWLLAGCAITSMCVLCALFLPRVWAPVQRALDWFAHVVSIAVSYALLGVLFVTCFVPIRGLLVLLGRDPLRRRKASDGDSYWETLPPTPAGSEHWRRQF